MSLRHLLFALGLVTCACSGALDRAAPNNPFHRERPTAAAASASLPDGKALDVGSWLDSSRATEPFTTFVTYWLSCDEDLASIELQIDPGDSRRVMWFPALFDYGPTPRSRNGYSLRSDAEQCLQRLSPIVAKYRLRTYGVHLADEPDVSQHNADITAAAALVRRVWGGELKVSINIAGVPAGLTIPEGLDRIALEGYGVDWLAHLRNLEAITPLPVLLTPPAFVRGAPQAQDAIVAQRVRNELAYAKTDRRVIGLYWFLWCCDDVTTGAKNFYAAGGMSLPLTQAAVRALHES